ncbi:hypothetical protein LB941_07315, partial [Ligilactobacillus sp. WILCCON 0076]|nr:hypothetical protein [Ligilactobacillus ubinensis]
APKVGSLLGGINKKFALIGILSGLTLLLVTPLFTIGILILSTFKSIFNSWLTGMYVSQNELPRDKRIWVKYTIQSMGSIMHQFILMVIGSLLVFENQSSIKHFFVITSQKIPTVESRALMTNWNEIATGILLIALSIYGLSSIIRLKVK